MKMVQLSDKALSICNAHWWPEKTRCHRCPIHTECTAPHIWGRDGLDDHNAKINAAAERVATCNA